MSKFEKALGVKYQENRASIMTRKFELGSHTFSVRVPSVGESEQMTNELNNPDLEKIDLVYKELTSQIVKFKNEKADNVEFKDDDIIIDGRSMKEAARNKVLMETRIVQYMKLLVPESGESLDDLEYSDIEVEFPFAIQIQFIEKITEAISPSYKDIRSK